MNLTTKGLILKEQNIGERDKLVTVLTEERGVLRAFVRGAKSVKSKKQAATTKFCYARLSLYSGKDSYIIDEAEALEMFFGLRDDLEKLALGEYFLELGLIFSPEEENARDNLRLLLNSLYMLANGKRPPEMLKALTELRLLTLGGYAPNLVACEKCGCFESDPMYFDISEGLLYCDNCAPATAPFALSLGVVNAMRHIVFSDFQKLYAFRTTGDVTEELAYVTEAYLRSRVERRLKTLEFYNSVRKL